MNALKLLVKRYVLVAAAALSLLGTVAVSTSPAFAATKEDICAGVGLSDGSQDCKEGAGDLTVQGAIRTAIRLLSYVAGVAAVIMVIIAGFRYITSNGDPAGIKSAKDAIIYAIVGLIVVAISQAIVKFVLNNTTNSDTNNKSNNSRSSQVIRHLQA